MRRAVFAAATVRLQRALLVCRADHAALQVICCAATGRACALFTFAALDCWHFLQATSGIAIDAKLRCLSTLQIKRLKILLRLFAKITLKLQKATAVQPQPVASAPRYAERYKRPFSNFTASLDSEISQTLSCAGAAAARVGAVLAGLFKSCEALAPAFAELHLMRVRPCHRQSRNWHLNARTGSRMHRGQLPSGIWRDGTRAHL
jgi:hypothetical protein